MTNTDIEPTQEEIASEIQGRFESVQKSLFKLQARMRSLQEDIDKETAWMQDIRREAKELGVELE
jgi:peptidoglycan hydrolase CwlO-like protein